MIKKYEEDGKKYYEVFVSLRNKENKQISKRRRGIVSEREAKTLEFNLRTELLGEVSAIRKVTFDEWRATVLERVEKNFKNKTLKNYKSYLSDKWITEEFRKTYIGDITPNQVKNLVNRSASGLSEVSQNTFLKVLKRAFEEALDDGLLVTNPARKILVRVPESSKLVLTSLEVNKLLQKAKEYSHEFFPVWTVAAMTGMRSGELQALLWSDVDFDQGLISVTKQWTRADGVTPTKSRSNRKVPINEELKRFLLELRAKSGEAPHVLPRIIEWYHGDQAKVLREFCVGIGITEIKFHDLRATFITNLLSAGVPQLKVQSIVGHKKSATTDLYARLAGVEIKGVTNAISYSVPQDTVGSNVVAIDFSKKSGDF